MKRLFSTVFMALLLSTGCFAKDHKPDPTKGEGEWGANGIAMVNSVDIKDRSREHLYIDGRLRNISSLRIQTIVVTVGYRDTDNTIVTGGTDTLNLNLDPNDAWRWHVEDAVVDQHHYYELLGITVDGQRLVKMSQ